ncbi:Lrp/AsnC family transcriptional regulator [Kibdelosporangium lantanae]|uniref:Lrp/AsnC family transcriptional regulator n=1 Tax=Kibdelosporangium lantanae TaxID=1497396 RepID=A0ABW3M430_9PSEU
MDQIDRDLLTHLQTNATTPYATLAEHIGLSTAATHERVRKLRDQGVIRATTIDIDPELVGRPVLAYITLDANTWMGGPETAEALQALPWLQEAHITAGTATILVKLRATSTQDLQNALKHLHDIPGVTRTTTTVVLETIFERPVNPHA